MYFPEIGDQESVVLSTRPKIFVGKGQTISIPVVESTGSTNIDSGLTTVRPGSQKGRKLVFPHDSNKNLRKNKSSKGKGTPKCMKSFSSCLEDHPADETGKALGKNTLDNFIVHLMCITL